MVQDLMHLIFCPDRANATFLQVVEHQERRCADLVGTPVKSNIRIRAERRFQIIQQVGNLDQNGLSAQEQTIVPNCRCQVRLAAVRSAKKDQPPVGDFSKLHRGIQCLMQSLDVLRRYFFANYFLILVRPPISILSFLDNGGDDFLASFIVSRLKIPKGHFLDI